MGDAIEIAPDEEAIGSALKAVRITALAFERHLHRTSSKVYRLRFNYLLGPTHHRGGGF